MFIDDIFVGNEQAVELFLAQHKGLYLKSFAPEDEDPASCRICGRPWNDPLAPDIETDTCDGNCLEGTGTKAYIVITREERSVFIEPSEITNEPEGEER